MFNHYHQSLNHPGFQIRVSNLNNAPIAWAYTSLAAGHSISDSHLSYQLLATKYWWEAMLQTKQRRTYKCL